MIEFFISSSKELLDILLVTTVVYQSYKLFKNTRAMPVVLGSILLLVISLLANYLELNTISWLFSVISNYIIIAVLVILAPELRRLISQFGQGRWMKELFPIAQLPVEPVFNAVSFLKEEKIGSLLVFSGRVGLRHLTENAIQLNAKLSSELLISIFFKNNPLHDGAAIVAGDIVISAATYLPMSSADTLKRTHGARHRAGLGITEETDSLSIITSEETGKLTICYMGELKENLDLSRLKSVITAFNNQRLKEEWEVLFPQKAGKKS